jgi:hypothetical protein
MYSTIAASTASRSSAFGGSAKKCSSHDAIDQGWW